MSALSKEEKLKNYLNDLPDFVFRYISHYYDGDSVNTQIAYAIDLRIFFQFLMFSHRFSEVTALDGFTTDHLEQITLDDLLDYKSYLKEYTITFTTDDGKIFTKKHTNSNFGINRKLSSLRGMFSYLYKSDRISHNITEKLDLTKLSQKIKKPLTSQETLRLLDVIFHGENYFEGRAKTEYLNRKLRDIAVYICYLGTGIRVSELVNLDICDLDFETSSFKVVRKGGDEDEIFMPPQVQDEIYAYLEERMKISTDSPALFLSRTNERLSVATVEHNLKTYCHAAGIYHKDKTRPHALRRTFACTLLADGVDIKMVAELMGHKNIEVTHKFYASHTAKARKEIMLGRTIPTEEE